jgi:hypothetical protein
LIWSICDFVNDTPTRRKAVMPLIGSFKRLPELDRRRLGVLAERHGHVAHDLRRLVEDVVAFAGLVPDVRERQQQVLARLGGLVVDPGLLQDRRGKVVTCFAVTPAISPVDFNTAFVCAVTFVDCVHSSQPIFSVATAPATPAAPNPSAAAFANFPIRLCDSSIDRSKREVSASRTASSFATVVAI